MIEDFLVRYGGGFEPRGLVVSAVGHTKTETSLIVHEISKRDTLRSAKKEENALYDYGVGGLS